MRNASCFVILLPHFPKEACKSNYVYTIVSLIGPSKYPTLHTNMHKVINSMTPKSDRNTYPANHCILPSIASHLCHQFYHQPF
jgi:hypothetical protein